MLRFGCLLSLLLAVCISAEEICECVNGDGSDYKGHTSVTKSGHDCQRWDAQFPNRHKKEEAANEENHCRNVGNRKGPWCYTTNPAVRQEYCAIPKCGERIIAFGNTYGNSMVLQRAPKQAVVWGYTECTEADVTVTLGSKTYQTKSAMGHGGVPTWRVDLDPQEAGGPHTIEATSNGVTVKLEDVLFGDVFMCAGQSNMEFTMEELDNPDPDIEDSVNYPNVRTFRTGRKFTEKPLYDIADEDIGQHWGKPDGGENMAKFSAVCWFLGVHLNTFLKIPIGLIESAYGGTRIQAWMPAVALEICFPDKSVSNATKVKNEPSGLWNAMIHPHLDQTIKGVVYYQGEANEFEPEAYLCALPVMQMSWRMSWLARNKHTDPMIPFGQVQLAPRNPSKFPTGFTQIRWEQTARLGYTPNRILHNVYTAIAIDLPDYKSPSGATHSRYKRPIAQRLYYGALQMVYGIKTEGPFQGPIPTDLSVGETVKIEYDDGSANLEQRASDGFEFCCGETPPDFCPGNGKWKASEILSVDKATVTLKHPCPKWYITGMRYLWSESPCELEKCPLYRVENELPVPPYTMNVSH